MDCGKLANQSAIVIKQLLAACAGLEWNGINIAAYHMADHIQCGVVAKGQGLTVRIAAHDIRNTCFVNTRVRHAVFPYQPEIIIHLHATQL